MRAHYTAPIQDTDGNLLPGSVIAVNQNGIPALLTAPIYADGTSATVMSNPFVSSDGYVDFYLDAPQRVDLQITAPGQTPGTFPDIDVNEAASSSVILTFAGSGPNSTQVGANAVASQAQAVALGDTSAATQIQATAAGQHAQASGAQSSAFGQASSASGSQSEALGANTAATQSGALAAGFGALAAGAGAVALGSNSGVSGDDGIAIGASAAAGNTGSAAIGSGAVTTEDNQIMLGTTGHSVDIPGIATLLSTPGQIKFRVYLTDSGQLYTRYHYPVAATNLLPTADQLTGSTIGSWADGSNVTVATSTAQLFGTETGSMKITQVAAGPAYAVPAGVSVAASAWYVGKVWFYRPAGSGTATQYQVWLAFYDSTHTLIGSASAGPAQTIVNNTWIAADVRAQAPSNAITAVLQAGVPSGGVNGDLLWAANAGIFAAPPVA